MVSIATRQAPSLLLECSITIVSHYQHQKLGKAVTKLQAAPEPDWPRNVELSRGFAPSHHSPGLPLEPEATTSSFHTSSIYN